MPAIPRSIHWLGLVVRNASFLPGLRDRSRIGDSRELPLVS
jgi:hypothetical protein